MKRCIDALGSCTSFYQLPGWEKSRGATIENEWAIKLGLRFLTEKEITQRLKGLAAGMEEEKNDRIHLQ